MAYNENINLFVTTDRNNADVFNAPLEKIIQNIQDTREYLYQIQAELDQLESKVQSEYTPTEQLNDLLAKGIKGDKGDTGESLEYNWDGTALGVKLESESDFTYRELKGEPGDVSTEQLEEALTDYPTLEYLEEVKTELESEIANIPKVTKTSELNNDSGFITEVDLEPYAFKTQIPTTLPANGGNSDTVGGKAFSEFVQMPSVRMSVSDLNNANYPYAYRSSISDGTQIGLPVEAWYHIDYFRHLDNNGFGRQVAYPLNQDGYVYTRLSIGTTWQAWKIIGDGGNASKVANNLTLQIAGTTKNTFDGSSAQTFNIPNASTSTAGVMTTAQVTKLNGIATGATNNVVDTAMSSTSTNAVQNKVIYNYIQQQLKNAGDYVGKTMINVEHTTSPGNANGYTYTNAKGGFADLIFYAIDGQFTLIVDGVTIISGKNPNLVLKSSVGTNKFELKIPFTSTFTVKSSVSSYLHGFIYVNK